MSAKVEIDKVRDKSPKRKEGKKKKAKPTEKKPAPTKATKPRAKKADSHENVVIGLAVDLMKLHEVDAAYKLLVSHLDTVKKKKAPKEKKLEL